MSLDPKDFIDETHLVDIGRVGSVIISAMDFARTDLRLGVTLAVDAGSALRDIISSSPQLSGVAVVPSDYPLTAYSSLATLRQPMEALTLLTVNPYASTVNVLASAGSVGIGIQNLYDTPGIAASINIPNHSLGNAVFQAGVTDSLRISSGIAAPYLASSAAVFSLETSYSKLFVEAEPAIGSAVASVGVPSHITALQSTVFGVSGALKDTWDSIRGDAAFLSVTSTSILRAPAVELYSATQAAAAISLSIKYQPAPDDELEEILDEEAYDFESRLEVIHPGLVVTYRGGLEALESGRADWQRHTMVSFRELSTHALHILAPDDKVLATAQQEDLHNGRPTRRARLNYIFAGMASPAIAKFYDADMKAAIELFELLNSGTHTLEQQATKEQVRYLRSRVVGLVCSMLEACDL